jgi:hypothetical protein
MVFADCLEAAAILAAVPDEKPVDSLPVHPLEKAFNASVSFLKDCSGGISYHLDKGVLVCHRYGIQGI